MVMYEEVIKIKMYARDNNIPIMLDDGIDYLCDYIKKNRVKRILEIGTAIGYSAIRMARISKSIAVTTIEKNEERYKMANANITSLGLKRQIRVICGDALNIDIDGKYDLIFIDGAKSHSIDFFNKYKDNLEDNGTIITDNMSFHGLVEDNNLVKTKNQRSLVNKIREYIYFLENNDEFTTMFVDVGDKIAISKRKDE